MDPGVLCPNSALEAIAWRAPQTAKDLRELRELKGWFQREFGAEVTQVSREVERSRGVGGQGRRQARGEGEALRYEKPPGPVPPALGAVAIWPPRSVPRRRGAVLGESAFWELGLRGVSEPSVRARSRPARAFQIAYPLVEHDSCQARQVCHRSRK